VGPPLQGRALARREVPTPALEPKRDPAKVGVHVIDDRYRRVDFSTLVLGYVDLENKNANPRYGLIRPRGPHGNIRSTRISAMSPV
jgi:hypothetical protein